jgi:16S rRNA (uracil1498-N3)-methyltransferase
MNHFITNKNSITESNITIKDPQELKHINKVLRMKKGETCTISDGARFTYTAELTAITEEGAVFKITDKQAAAAEPKVQVTLFQCVPKHGKMETIIQKTTELGVARVIPVFSARSIPKQKEITKTDRWQKIAAEASKQSKRSTVPEITDPIKFQDLSGRLNDYDLIVFPYEGARGITIKQILSQANPGLEQKHFPQGDGTSASAACASLKRCTQRPLEGNTSAPSLVDIALVIGPEGGFSEEEVAEISHAGATPCSLGGTILRTETAGPAALAMILYELEL